MSDTPSAPVSWKNLPWLHAHDRTVWRDRILLAVVLLVFYTPLLGSFGLWDPWETHYGEVARQITERGDWISTFWGSHWQHASGDNVGRHFFSKPIWLMWMMAMGMEVFGFSEWGIRLGVMLTSVLCAVSIYTVGEKIWDRRAGALMALVTGTSPFFFFLSRQAQTDMPFVGFMTIGLCFFLMALFARDRNAPATRLNLALGLGGLLVLFVPQMTIIGTGLSNWRGDLVPLPVALFYWGPVQDVLYSALVLVVILTTALGKLRTKQQLYLYTFYVFIALASVSKGLLGFALPGAFIFFYLLLTGQWRRLREVELFRGAALFIAIGFPWYVAMLIRHGYAYYLRFFIHDHFKRLATGVHQIDSGSFEHYIQWLGYGLWPWGALLPAALILLLSGAHKPQNRDKQHAQMFVVIWLVFTFALFTLSSTKFHHYIFPAVPAACMLVALLLHKMGAGIRTASGAPLVQLPGLVWLSVMGLVVFVGWDIFADPQHLKNLFTYKYDRRWDLAWNPGFQFHIGGAVLLASLGTFLLAANRFSLRRIAVPILGLGALWLTAFGLYLYMPTVAHTWSQKGTWDAYYERCTPAQGPPGHDFKKRYCEELVLSYKLNWRGETFYTQNEVIPVRTDTELQHFLEENKGKPFYGLMDKGRFYTDFKRKLPAPMKSTACLIDVNNLKFGLAQVPCKTSKDHQILEAEAKRAPTPDQP